MRYKLLIIVALLIFVQISFGQKVKPRPQPTPTHKQDKMTAKQIAELLAQVNDLIEQGSQKFKVKDFQIAIQDFDAAIKLIDSAKGQLGNDGKYLKAISLFSIGTAYQKLNETEKSTATLEKSLPIYSEIKLEDDFLALTFRQLGTNYQKQNNPEKAVENFEKMIVVSRILLNAANNQSEKGEIKDEIGETLLLLCDSLLLLGEKLRALKAVQEAYEIFSATDKPFQQAGSLGRIARINFELGNTKEALGYYQQTLDLSRTDEIKKQNSVGAIQLEAVTLNSIGYFYTMNGDKSTSFEFYQKALELCNSNQIDEPKPLILHNLGYYYLELGDFSKAIETLKLSLEISQKLKDDTFTALTFNNIGVSYFELGNMEKAIYFWDQALDSATKNNNYDALALILTNNAGQLLAAGQVEKATEFAQIAQKYFERSKDKPKIANILSILARISQTKGDFENAIKLFQDSNNLAAEVGNKKLITTNQVFISEVYLQTKNYEKASQNYFSALQSSQKNKDAVYEAYSLFGLSIVAKIQQNAPLSILYGKKAINQFQSLRANIKSLDKETQTLFLESIKQAYQHLADLLISVGRIAEAEQVLALLKEEEFYEYVRRDDKVAKELTAKLSLTDDETAAFKRYNEFSENIAAIGLEYSELEAEKKKLAPNQIFSKQAKLEELGKKLKDATEVFLKFLDELKVEFGENNSRVAQIDSGLQAMLKEMNATETVIISTIASSERLNLILTTTSFQKAYTVDISSSDLDKLVTDFRRVIQDSAVDPRPIGQKLYNILVKPLAKDLADAKVKTIVWSLDGTLRYVAISALWDGKKYLAESYANAVITLASRDKLKDFPSDKSTWKTVGFGVSKSATVEETEAGAPIKRDFGALPSVPEELCKVVSDNESIAKCAEKGIINGRRFLDEQFTLQEFKNQLGKFPLVHIASHFSLKAGNDKNSYLLLGGGDERRLTIAELNRSNAIFVGVELLTLSACNTAMPGEKKANGVEIEGFGAIAQKQGAKSVLATLWSVADPSTRDLMNEFYTFLSVQKLSKAESLRQAQIKLIYGKYNAEEIPKLRSDLAGEIPADAQQIPFQKDLTRPFAHPFYWSPFVLIGNWQ